VDAILIRALRCDDLGCARDAALALVRTRRDRADLAPPHPRLPGALLGDG